MLQSKLFGKQDLVFHPLCKAMDVRSFERFQWKVQITGKKCGLKLPLLDNLKYTSTRNGIDQQIRDKFVKK
jgi:hypothetical protein